MMNYDMFECVSWKLLLFRLCVLTRSFLISLGRTQNPFQLGIVDHRYIFARSYS